MKFRHTFELGITALLAIVVGLVAVTGWLAYERFTTIVDSISEEARPDMQLVAMEKVLTNLSEAENSVKSYSLTREDDYLTQFYDIAQETDTQMQDLQRLMQEDEQAMVKLDSLGSLVDQKFNVLNDLLVLQDKFRVQQALDKVLARIEREAEAADTLKTQVDTTEIADATEEKKKRGFLWGIFSKKEKEPEPETEPLDTATVEEPEVTISKVNEAAEEIRKEEAVIDARLKQRELALIKEDQVVMSKIHELFDTMKQEEIQTLSSQAQQAEKDVRDTNMIIAGFCILAAVLLILAALIISTYVRNNRRYRKALAEAKTEAEALATAKEQFLANMSHEIRTPMNAIAGFSEQLSQSQLSDEQRKQVNIVQKSADHLLHIVNDVLDLTKLRSGRLELESIPFEVAGIVEEVIQLMQPSAEGKEVALKSTVDVEVPAVVVGDPVRLRQALLNLVGNAIKFTHEGSVSIHVSTAKKSKSRAEVDFSVTDTGLGIDKANLEKIFEEFEQGETSTTRNYGGTGLGLAITRKLVLAHDGDIRIDSTPGEGTTIAFTIPYKRGTKDMLQSLQESAEELSVGEGMRVLVVDDEPFNRKLLTAILNKHNIQYQEATNGEEGLHLLAEHKFDLVLMDARMPKLTGVEATRRIRALGNSVPIVALTAAVSDADKKRYAEAGMDSVLSKPFKEHQLIRTINELLSSNLKDNEPEDNDEHTAGQFDPSELKEMSGGDDHFYREMLETFVHSAEEGLHRIKGALENGDGEEMSEAAHKLCPPARHLKADRLLGYLKEIEREALQIRDKEEMAPLVLKTEKEGKAIIARIKALPILNHLEA